MPNIRNRNTILVPAYSVHSVAMGFEGLKELHESKNYVAFNTFVPAFDEGMKLRQKLKGLPPLKDFKEIDLKNVDNEIVGNRLIKNIKGVQEAAGRSGIVNSLKKLNSKLIMPVINFIIPRHIAENRVINSLIFENSFFQSIADYIGHYLHVFGLILTPIDVGPTRLVLFNQAMYLQATKGALEKRIQNYNALEAAKDPDPKNQAMMDLEKEQIESLKIHVKVEEGRLLIEGFKYFFELIKLLISHSALIWTFSPFKTLTDILSILEKIPWLTESLGCIISFFTYSQVSDKKERVDRWRKDFLQEHRRGQIEIKKTVGVEAEEKNPLKLEMAETKWDVHYEPFYLGEPAQHAVRFQGSPRPIEESDDSIRNSDKDISSDFEEEPPLPSETSKKVENLELKEDRGTVKDRAAPQQRQTIHQKEKYAWVEQNWKKLYAHCLNIQEGENQRLDAIIKTSKSLIEKRKALRDKKILQVAVQENAQQKVESFLNRWKKEGIPIDGFYPWAAEQRPEELIRLYVEYQETIDSNLLNAVAQMNNNKQVLESKFIEFKYKQSSVSLKISTISLIAAIVFGTASFFAMPIPGATIALVILSGASLGLNLGYWWARSRLGSQFKSNSSTMLNLKILFKNIQAEVKTYWHRVLEEELKRKYPGFENAISGTRVITDFLEGAELKTYLTSKEAFTRLTSELDQLKKERREKEWVDFVKFASLGESGLNRSSHVEIIRDMLRDLDFSMMSGDLRNLLTKYMGFDLKRLERNLHKNYDLRRPDEEKKQDQVFDTFAKDWLNFYTMDDSALANFVEYQQTQSEVAPSA